MIQNQNQKLSILKCMVGKVYEFAIVQVPQAFKRMS